MEWDLFRRGDRGKGGRGKAKGRRREGKVRFLFGFWSGSEGSEQEFREGGLGHWARLALECIAARGGARQPSNTRFCPCSDWGAGYVLHFVNHFLWGGTRRVFVIICLDYLI
jgi:hypothetical protein